MFKGKDLLTRTKKEMQDIRGNEISIIFQEPMTSLNPVFTVKRQLTETLLRHQNINEKEALEKAVHMLLASYHRNRNSFNSVNDFMSMPAVCSQP